MKNKKVNIGLVGLGNIGSYFFNSILNNKKTIALETGKEPVIKYISAKNKYKKRPVKFKNAKWINNPMDLVKKNDVDIIVELVGGAGGIAKKLIKQAIINKKNVITANKSLIAAHGDALAKLAESNKVSLEYEASVAGGIPILRSIKDGLIVNKINKISGILNGTSNFILSTMDNNGKKFSDALNDAKNNGYTESNPKNDLNGNDMADKLRILSSLAFNKKISKNTFLVEGIENIEQVDILNAGNLGYKIKLLAISELKNNKLLERVHPCLVLNNSYIANIDGVLNAIIVDGFPIGRTIFQGEGAGPGPTTSALISDLCSILRGDVKYPFGVSSKFRKQIKILQYHKRKCSCYLRIEAKDRYGVLSSITKTLAKNKISIKRLIQIPDKIKMMASIIMVTHESSEKNFENCLLTLMKNNFIMKKPVLIRIENT